MPTIPTKSLLSLEIQQLQKSIESLQKSFTTYNFEGRTKLHGKWVEADSVVRKTGRNSMVLTF